MCQIEISAYHATYVENWIDAGIQVEHNSTKVENVVVKLLPHAFHPRVRSQDDVHCKNSEWEQTDEEKEYNCCQHDHHLQNK